MKKHRLRARNAAAFMQALLLAAIALLTACSGGGGNTASTTAAAGDTVTEEVVTGETTLPSNLPPSDFDGFELTFLRSEKFFTEKGIYSEELTGDPVPDAIYERNLKIETDYNCKITVLETQTRYPADDVAKYVLAGDDTVDVNLCGGTFTARRISDYLALNQLPYFDFSKPWWNERFNNGISLGGNVYFTVGDHMILAKQNLYFIIFNKDIATDYGMDPEGFYQHVYDDEWTLDRLSSYARTVKDDLNGDGVYDVNDLWGLLGENYCTWTLALGSGFRCAEKDGDDLPYITFDSEKNVQVIDKVFALTADRDTTYFAQRFKGTSDVWKEYSRMRSAPQWLFIIAGLGNSMREAEFDYGLVPTPKFTETQEYYYHDASLGNNPVMSIPVSASSPDTVSFIIEAMAYESHYMVMPVFYDNYLHTKLARDEESVEMLRMIHGSLFYDIGSLFDWGSMRMIVENLPDKAENTFASTYAASAGKIQADLEVTLKMIAEK